MEWEIFLKDFYLLRITSKIHFRFYATVVKLEPMDIANKISALEINLKVPPTNFVVKLRRSRGNFLGCSCGSHKFCESH